MAKARGEIWQARPADKDYPAAQDYLSLLCGEADARKLVRRLRQAPITHRQAKDLLRASQAPLLEKGNPQMAADLRKIKTGKKLSPVLLVRGDLRTGMPLTIADGYHRICASWHWDEDAPVACCIVNR